jgi:hypothetical protein
MMTIDELDDGERWYVQLAPRATLSELEVIETTENTVLLRDNNKNSSCFNTARYKFTDIEFVEAC